MINGEDNVAAQSSGGSASLAAKAALSAACLSQRSVWRYQKYGVASAKYQCMSKISKMAKTA
jgi:hypothetical protein